MPNMAHAADGALAGCAPRLMPSVRQTWELTDRAGV
jgi:hypothetical protein